jgi:hypothetical protein
MKTENISTAKVVVAREVSGEKEGKVMFYRMEKGVKNIPSHISN